MSEPAVRPQFSPADTGPVRSGSGLIKAILACSLNKHVLWSKVKVQVTSHSCLSMVAIVVTISVLDEVNGK